MFHAINCGLMLDKLSPILICTNRIRGVHSPYDEIVGITKYYVALNFTAIESKLAKYQCGFTLGELK